MSEQEVRAALLQWARSHWSDEEGQVPQVEIVSMREIDQDEWEAELSVSTSADTPTVVCFWDEQGRLHVSSVEY